MCSYNDPERRSDFEFFKKNYQDLFKKFGHKFLAIKNKEILVLYPASF